MAAPEAAREATARTAFDEAAAHLSRAAFEGPLAFGEGPEAMFGLAMSLWRLSSTWPTVPLPAAGWPGRPD